MSGVKQPKPRTVREALRERCGVGPSSYNKDGEFLRYKRGCSGDDEVVVNRHALRILFQGLLAAEQYRRAALVDVSVKVAREFGDKYEAEIKAAATAGVDLDEALSALEAPA